MLSVCVQNTHTIYIIHTYIICIKFIQFGEATDEMEYSELSDKQSSGKLISVNFLDLDNMQKRATFYEKCL